MTDELADLAELHRAAIAAAHGVTLLGEELVASGVALADVCDALDIDRRGWYRRLDALAAWRNQ